MAPTAQIQTEETKSEEIVSTTTSVEEQEQPSFQATSTVNRPEQITEKSEEIIVQTEVRRERKITASDRLRRLFQTTIPIEHIVDVKTTSTEEEQIQPTVNVIEDQVLKTTTEVEEVSKHDLMCAVSLCAVMIERTFFASLPSQYRHC